VRKQGDTVAKIRPPKRKQGDKVQLIHTLKNNQKDTVENAYSKVQPDKELLLLKTQLLYNVYLASAQCYVMQWYLIDNFGYYL